MNFSSITGQSKIEIESSLGSSITNGESSTNRRHDLDALRAIAMLLGIILHGALSFTPIPWTVQDTQQNDFFYYLFAFIHGFRMPLFFLLSGFFTAMLWRQRGLGQLIKHRLKRIFLPLVIGCFTIIPAMWVASIIASGPAPGCPESSPLYKAVVSGDLLKVKQELAQEDPKINQLDPDSGTTPLAVAIFFGHTKMVPLLLEAGADVHISDKERSTPLHVSAFMGRAEAAKRLVEAGANPEAKDRNNQTPKQILKLDFGTTNFFASALGQPVAEKELKAGRKKIAELLGETDYLGSPNSDSKEGQLNALSGLLFYLPVFMHLWFLWFLCWLILAFAIYATVGRNYRIKSIGKSITLSNIRLLWLVPITMALSAMMPAGTFGPESSVGLFPIPRVLAYYAVFFFFGALYWDADDQKNLIGKNWAVQLFVALLVVFPLGIDLTTGKLGITFFISSSNARFWLGLLFQSIFTWMMTFGLMGLFHRCFSGQNKVIRYLSDSSYWLYLVHLPLVILAQWLMKESSIPSGLKFLTISLLTSGLLLLSYHYLVRYSFVGRLLNGSRRPSVAN